MNAASKKGNAPQSFRPPARRREGWLQRYVGSQIGGGFATELTEGAVDIPPPRESPGAELQQDTFGRRIHSIPAVEAEGNASADFAKVACAVKISQRREKAAWMLIGAGIPEHWRRPGDSPWRPSEEPVRAVR